MTGFLNKTFWGGKKHKAGLAVAASPVSISASGIGPVNSAAMTATTTGGTAPYTYSWALQPGSHGITITSPTAKTTATSATLSSGDFLVAFAVCTVTDNVGAVVASNQVSIQYTATSVPAGTAVLTRTITNLSGSSLPATAFWYIGQPFAPDEVPPGSIVTASLNGTNIPITAVAQKYKANGSLDRSEFILDFSGISMAAGTSQTLSFPILSGSWSTTTARTNSDWSGLIDTVELTNLTTSGTSASDMDKAGTWIAAFNAGATNTIEIVGQGPQGLYVNVKATLVNTGTTHAYLMARMEYLVCQKADTSLGPIAYRGPFIENIQLLKQNAEGAVNPSQFTYDLNWKRNGVAQRSQLQVSNIAGSIAQMLRYDGQWDWNTTDPKIGVTQDYTLTRKTLKIPPFLTGITYTGNSGCAPHASVTGINTSTGVFTIGNTNNLFGPVHEPSAIGFTATGTPTGLSLDPQIYWASYIDGSTFLIYDTFAHALAQGSTGKIIPSTAGSGVVARISIAPQTPGLFEQYMPSAGSRNDISLLSEWGSAFHVGNTSDFQRVARVQAYAMASIPINCINDATGKIPNCINTPIIGLGTPMPTTIYPSVTGGGNNWSPDTGHWPGSVHYSVWLMEGGTVLRDLMLMVANVAILGNSYGPTRNIIIGGTTYYGSCMYMSYSGGNARYAAWQIRHFAYAGFAAVNGSPEETYCRDVFANNCAMAAAYLAYKGGNYGNLGACYYNDLDAPPTGHPIFTPFVEGFMQSYLGLAAAVAALLHGDCVSGLNTMATYCSKWLVGLYTSSFPSYFATAYVTGPCLTDDGVTGPGTYVADFTELGLGAGSNIGFLMTSGSATITIDTSGGFSPPLWPLAAGDKYRPQNYCCLDLGAGTVAAPSPYSDGTVYTITSVGSGTFSVSIMAGSTPSSQVGGWLLPTGQANPNSGTISGDQGQADGYLMYQIAGLAVEAVYGATNASTAYANAFSRFTGSAAFANQCMWAFQDSV